MTEKTIHMTFIDVSNESVIAEADFPADQLPVQFETQTMLNISGSQWSVVEAIPMHAQEFMQTGQLTLRLSRIEEIDPNELLFSLPTIADALPQTAEQSSYTAFELWLHEDDWRQYEFLRKEQSAQMDEELRSIAGIWENHCANQGAEYMAFDSLHVRRAIGEPELGLSLTALLKLLRTPALQESSFGALRIGADEAYVKNGFAIATPGGTLYGLLSLGKDAGEKTVELLGLDPHVNEEVCKIMPEGEGAMYEPNLADHIAQAFGLLFINWCGCEVRPKPADADQKSF